MPLNMSLVLNLNSVSLQFAIIKLVIIIIGIQPLGRSGQRPEFSQATGMALVRCILGKFLGVVCHCFPPIKLVSSANRIGLDLSDMLLERSLMYIKNNNGPRMEPGGTP